MRLRVPRRTPPAASSTPATTPAMRSRHGVLPSFSRLVFGPLAPRGLGGAGALRAWLGLGLGLGLELGLGLGLGLGFGLA